MIGKIRKGLMKQFLEGEKPAEAPPEPPEAEARKGGKAKPAPRMPAGRQSVLGTILEESFSRVRQDIEHVRELQERQSNELKGVLTSVERLTKQHTNLQDAQKDSKGLAAELKDVRTRLEELQRSHEMKFNTQIRDMLDQLEGVRRDVGKSEVHLDEGLFREHFDKIAKKDLALKHEVESRLGGITTEVSHLADKIQEKEDAMRKHLAELKNAGGKADDASVAKLFEDLNELDNEIIDLKREMNKERKVSLDIRKDMDELSSAVRELKELEGSLSENTRQIGELQRIIGTDFKTKYY